MAHYEEFSTRQQAVKRESDLKAGFGRKWLKKLIASGRARQAGMDTETALSACDLPGCSAQAGAQAGALFPDSFEDSPLGKIPKGWMAGTLTDFAALNPDTWSKDTAPVQIEYVDLSNTKWGRIESTTKYLWKEAPSRAQRVLAPGDTIVGTVRPANGSYAFISDEGLTGSTGFAVLRPQKSEFKGFVYLAATDPDNIGRLAHLAEGAAYPAVRPEVVATTQIVKSPQAVIEHFGRMAHPLLDKMVANDHESRTLTAVRDALLPKLISGELRVPRAQKTTARAT